MSANRNSITNAIAAAAVLALSVEQLAMGDWKPIEDWAQCAEMARPGIIFEIRNAEGQSLFTPCVVPLPTMPVNWKSPPKEFRPISEPRPQHSSPMPPPNPGGSGHSK